MKKEDKSLLDELFEAAGLNNEQPAKEQQKNEEIEDIPSKTEKPEEIPAINQDISKESEKKEEKKTAEDHATKKKDIKFLVIYTTVFVIVISSLITGSYFITSRIHQQMAESNENLNTSQSTLKNIQDENNALKQENAALKIENDLLSATAEDANTLMESIGDMVEHDGYLAAAQSAYIDGERENARTLMAAIDRDKLSQPAKAYYDLLKDKLGL